MKQPKFHLERAPGSPWGSCAASRGNPKAKVLTYSEFMETPPSLCCDSCFHAARKDVRGY